MKYKFKEKINLFLEQNQKKNDKYNILNSKMIVICSLNFELYTVPNTH